MDLEAKPNDYPNIFYSSILFQLSGGALRPKKKNSLFQYYLHYSYNVILAIYGLLTVFLEFTIMKDIYGNLNILIKCCGMALTHVMGVVKSFIFLKYDRKFGEIMRILQDEKFQYEEFQEFSPLKINTDQKKIIDRLVMTHGLLASGVGLSGYASSIFRIVNYQGDRTFSNDTTCQDFMPYPCYIPVPIHTMYGCNWAVFIYSVAVVLYAFPIAAFDCSFAAFIISIQANFLTIGGAFKTIRQRSLVKLGYGPTLKAFKDSDIPKLEPQMMKEITKCTAHLQAVLRSCTEVENLFGYVILFQLLISLTVCAALLCTTSSVDVLSPESISQMQFYGAMTFELSIFCYFGNELYLACDSIRKSIYESDWLSASTPYKKYMLMTLCRLQRPVYITIGKYSNLTLATLLMVVRATFSVLTLYKSVM